MGVFLLKKDPLMLIRGGGDAASRCFEKGNGTEEFEKHWNFRLIGRFDRSNIMMGT